MPNDTIPLPPGEIMGTYNGTPLIRYTAETMHAHAAAVSAADNDALRERIKVLEDALENITDITAKETIHKIARAALGDKHD